MTNVAEDWPDDADGDVFRRLAEHGFDFSKQYCVDYNVDFEVWPPAQAAIEHLESMYGPITLHDPSGRSGGYIQFNILGRLTYEEVTSIQRKVSAAMKPYGGICESWGVLQDAP